MVVENIIVKRFLVSFVVLDDNIIKGLIEVLSVEGYLVKSFKAQE
jgi:hypothetical protein